MNIGILGTGSIAEKMSATINKMNNAHLYAVASRTAEKAKSFSERYHIENYYATYEELVKDKNIDLVPAGVLTTAIDLLLCFASITL